MRLLNVETFALEDFFSTETQPQYAILSHTWDGGEVTHQDIQDLEQAQQKDGFHKIRYICEQARQDGLGYAWVDTCCIDKTSSHELSEAINSMFRWYMNAAVCYVYLSDVPGNCPPLSDEVCFHPSSLRWIETFEESRWFTRGWTLQELIAPRLVIFFGHCWNYIGSLPELLPRVSGITNVQTDVLDHSRPLSDLSIARRLSWAATRQTTRIEDQAYSLFGILDVNMPLLYGEGSKAFLRLQEQIIWHSTDQSIFAWDAPPGLIESRELLFAPSPRCFLNGGRIRRWRGAANESAFRISNKGVEITLPIMSMRLQEDPSHPYVTLGILDCKYEGSSNVLALVMKQHPFNVQGTTPSVELYVSGYERMLESNVTQYGRIKTLHPREIRDAEQRALTITKDLQSQTYIQAFSTNKTTWFPIRFTGDAQSQLPTLQNVYPEECWYGNSQTMRLRLPHHPYGGIVVRIRDGKHFLLAFGVPPAQSSTSAPSRKIYAICQIDPYCPIEPHLQSFMKKSQRTGVEGAKLKLNNDDQLIALLWNGALTVSIENVDDVRTPHSPSIHSMSPPSSPIATSRKLSFTSLPRRDSVLQEQRSERSDDSPEDPPSRAHRSRQCENCRKMKAEQDREEYERQRKMEEDLATKRKAETMEKRKTQAKKVVTGITFTSMLADLAELA